MFLKEQCRHFIKLFFIIENTLILQYEQQIQRLDKKPTVSHVIEGGA